jgi:hypothetical protein
MNRMCCASCSDQNQAISEKAHTITDAAGRQWSFEAHYWVGPIVLRKDGRPAARQLGDASPFWAAYQSWREGRA